ncbi:DNA-binding transcriptional regulator, MarR family [Actinacidiphila alni]|uniref:DNA-binding transcriptional regulator, MarR family n=1 Tax=Actinacidiphila alni TaxID=380248 RepID=A0A1I2LDQ3_9ACTN|nr:MarR family transcriptional regulator [Actinacidiphila alni]SFF76620.1 DNA-binding transcriptional regulator, MarR family [Actinacidiphila alni]
MTEESTDPTAELLELARQMSEPIRRLSVLWSRAQTRVNPQLSTQQMRVLEGVDASPGVNLTSLAKTLDLGVPAASRLCDRLEAAGLLDRRGSAHNRREITLATTGRGRDLLEKVSAQRRSDLAAVLRDLTPRRRRELLRALQALQECLP